MTGNRPMVRRSAAEVVELHGAFEIVEAVIELVDRAADRAAGVVDQEIDAAVIGDHFLDQPVAVFHVGDIDRCRR